MPIYIEHDYYPLDVFIEFNPADPRQCGPGRQAPAAGSRLDQEKTGLQIMQAQVELKTR